MYNKYLTLCYIVKKNGWPIFFYNITLCYIVNKSFQIGKSLPLCKWQPIPVSFLSMMSADVNLKMISALVTQ